MAAEEKDRNLFSPGNIFLGTATLIILLALIIAGYFYYQYRQAQSLLQNPNLAAEQQTNNLINSVAKLIDLPKDETPTIATVSDETKLKGQTFFQNAKNGDKVLIYTKAKEAILYDPNTNKIIAVAPVNIGNSTTSPVPVRVTIFNGTSTSGLATTVSSQLQTKFGPSINIVSKADAKQSYSKTLVVDLTGQNSQLASQIASDLNGSVGSLPASESAPLNTDILVIVGR